MELKPVRDFRLRWQPMYAATGARVPRYALEGARQADADYYYRLIRRWQPIYDATGRRVPRYALEGVANVADELKRELDELGRRMRARNERIDKVLSTTAGREEGARVVTRMLASRAKAEGGLTGVASWLSDRWNEVVTGEDWGSATEDRERLDHLQVVAQEQGREDLVAQAEQQKEELGAASDAFIETTTRVVGERAAAMVGAAGDVASKIGESAKQALGAAVGIVKYLPYIAVGLGGLVVYSRLKPRRREKA